MCLHSNSRGHPRDLAPLLLQRNNHWGVVVTWDKNPAVSCRKELVEWVRTAVAGVHMPEVYGGRALNFTQQTVLKYRYRNAGEQTS